jgi:hypothetical protein
LKSKKKPYNHQQSSNNNNKRAKAPGMFTLYKSKVDKTTSQYQENYKRMKMLVDDLNEKLKLALGQGKEIHIKRHLESGKMLARDRIELLLDEVRK